MPTQIRHLLCSSCGLVFTETPTGPTPDPTDVGPEDRANRHGRCPRCQVGGEHLVETGPTTYI